MQHICSMWKIGNVQFDVFDESWVANESSRRVHEKKKKKKNKKTEKKAEKKYKNKKRANNQYPSGIQWLPYTSAHSIFNIQPNDLVKKK